jgi:hypothetical protein
MEKNLITEIHRISELIGVKNKITLNEGVLGKLFKDVAEGELEALIRQEVRNAILSGVKTVEKDAATLAAAEAKVLSKIGGKTLTNAQKKGVQAELFRLAKEEAETLGKRNVGSTKGLTAAQNDAYQKAAAAERTRLGVKSLGQGTREKLIKKITTGGEEVTLKATKIPPKNITNPAIKQSMKEAVEISFKQKWNWSRWLKWAKPLGLSGLAVWWLIANWDDEEKPIVPEGMPKTDEGLTDTGGDGNTGGGDGNTGGGNTGGGNTGGGEYQPKEDGAYTTPGDPYQYRVVNGQWETKSWKNKGKIIKNWVSLENNPDATGILDTRHPGVRTANKPTEEKLPPAKTDDYGLEDGESDSEESNNIQDK